MSIAWWWHCQWPAKLGVCGAKADYYIDQGSSHRPICKKCSNVAMDANPLVRIGPLNEIESLKVPTFYADDSVEPAVGNYSKAVKNADAEPEPTSSRVEPNSSSHAPLKVALTDLAVSALQLAKLKLEDWGRR
jgi:hypothetical protein